MCNLSPPHLPSLTSLLTPLPLPHPVGLEKTPCRRQCLGVVAETVERPAQVRGGEEERGRGRGEGEVHERGGGA